MVIVVKKVEFVNDRHLTAGRNRPTGHRKLVISQRERVDICSNDGSSDIAPPRRSNEGNEKHIATLNDVNVSFAATLALQSSLSDDALALHRLFRSFLDGVRVL
jgi:hypothetical protein